MEKFIAIIIMAIIVEGTISYTKMIVVNKKIQWQVVLAIILGVFVCIAYDLDVLRMLGLQSQIAYVGVVLTGIAISRGSNYIYDLIKRLTNPIEV